MRFNSRQYPTKHQSLLGRHTMSEAVSLPLTLGAIEIGVLVSSLLYGISCVQVWLYASGTQPRRPAFAALVTFIL
jgi:hypothetical protein